MLDSNLHATLVSKYDLVSGYTVLFCLFCFLSHVVCLEDQMEKAHLILRKGFIQQHTLQEAFRPVDSQATDHQEQAHVLQTTLTILQEGRHRGHF